VNNEPTGRSSPSSPLPAADCAREGQHPRPATPDPIVVAPVRIGRPAGSRSESDPLIAALTRYVEALHRRYPDGPEQMRREGLDGRANITGMHPPKKNTAA